MLDFSKGFKKEVGPNTRFRQFLQCDWMTFLWQILTLSGTGQDIFIPLSLLDQILSAEFFVKNFQTFLEVKKTSIGLF